MLDQCIETDTRHLKAQVLIINWCMCNQLNNLLTGPSHGSSVTMKISYCLQIVYVTIIAKQLLARAATWVYDSSIMTIYVEQTNREPKAHLKTLFVCKISACWPLQHGSKLFVCV
jgi:hypothetical protein